MTGDTPPLPAYEEPAGASTNRLQEESLGLVAARQEGDGKNAAQIGDSSESALEKLAQAAWGSDEMKFQTGQIDSIELPDGWVKGGTGGNDQATYREFHPEGEAGDKLPDTRIEFFYRGQKVPEREGERFSELLKNRGHELSRPEFMSLGSILQGKENPADFKLDKAWVDEVNSRPVLMIEGKFAENGKRTLLMLIDSDNTGRAVQEVSLIAPEAKYAAVKPDFEKSLKTIEWKKAR